MEFKADFITYEGVYLTIMTEKLNLPTSEGRRTILSNHMDIMLSLDVGIIETSEEKLLKHYVINGGVLYFKDNVAEIVTDNVIAIKDIDADRAMASLKKFTDALNRTDRPNERARLEEKIRTAQVILEAAEKYGEQGY